MVKNIFYFMFFSIIALAESEVTAELSETRIQQSESVKLIINATSDKGGDRTTQPTFTAPDFEVASNYSSLSQSSTMVNGKFSFQVIRTYTFVLFPKKIGNLQITNIRMTVDEQEKKLPDLSLKVLDIGSGQNLTGGQQGNPNAGGGNQNQGGEEDNGTYAGEDFLIKSSIEPRVVYVGERINADYFFYKRKDVSSFDLPVIPKFEGFWRETVMFAKTFNWQRAKLGNYLYDRTLFSSYALFPLKTGKLTIEPMTSRIIYNGMASADDIFGGIFQLTKRYRKDVIGGSASIEVKPLPEENKPQNYFPGMVGTLKLDMSLDKTRVDVNKPLVLMVKAEGTVNLNALDKISLPYPKHIEVYDPKIYTDIDYKNAEKKFEILLIPRSGGHFVIPSWKFSLFNPTTKKYEEISSPELQFDVDGPVISEQNLAAADRAKNEPTKEEFTINEGDKTYYYFRMVVKVISGIFILALVFFFVRRAKDKVKAKRDQLYRYEIWLKKIQREKDLARAYIESFNWIVSLVNETVIEGLSVEDKITEISDEKLRTDVKDYYRLLEKRQFTGVKSEQSKEDLEKIVQGLRGIKSGIEKWKKLLA